MTEGNKLNPPADFLGYPTPQEYTAHPYVPRTSENPVLRGLPLVIGSEAYV